MDKHLHIVIHDVPWPVDHGGLVDLFYKLVALHKCGVQIHLHCFRNKGRREEPELEKYCVSVNYYTRKTGLAGVSFTIPYIVHSRNSRELSAILQNDNYPILLEGIHCTALLREGVFKERKVFVRLHNIEYKYYDQLAKHENNIFKKIYYRIESRLLKNYERSIARKTAFLAVSANDTTVYKSEFKAAVILLPVFLPYSEITTQPGKGCFCLYHGNLSVNENEKAACWLLYEVFDTLEIPFVIAGRNPSPHLKKLADKPYTSMVVNPTVEEMQDLIKKAQVNILPAFNTTGVKLKLLNALYNGRHCLVNESAIAGSGLEGLCKVANNAEEFKQQINSLYALSFSEEQIKMRSDILQNVYDNEKNAQQLMTLIW